MSDIEKKQLVLIKYIQNLVGVNWKVKAEYSTNDNDVKVITVQEVAGQKVVFYGNTTPLFNYYMIDIYGTSIQENKNISLLIGNLIGKNELIDYDNGKWQIMFKQFTNPQAIAYEDIRRVSYNMTIQCIIGRIS